MKTSEPPKRKHSNKKHSERKNSFSRNPDSHKGQNGRVLVVGGSEDYVGAPALAGLAALRAGADLVTIAAPQKVAWAINCLSPDLITKKLRGDKLGKQHVNAVLKLAKTSDAVLIGNGLGKADMLVNNTLRDLKGQVPCVVDADAVKTAKINNMHNCIITPHQKEFETFLETNKVTVDLDKKLKTDEKIKAIRRGLCDFFQQENTLLLKGKKDLIITESRSFISTGGNAGMTVGGTGDVLAGLSAGYIAQNADPFTSASFASMNCKKIGDALMKKSNFGFGYIASDFLKEIKKMPRVKSR